MAKAKRKFREIIPNELEFPHVIDTWRVGISEDNFITLDFAKNTGENELTVVSRIAIPADNISAFLGYLLINIGEINKDENLDIEFFKHLTIIDKEEEGNK